MKIFYSPYFNGHSYVNYATKTECHGGLLGAVLESTEGLLSRIELMCGKAFPDYDHEDSRVKAYYDVLRQTVDAGQAECESLANDASETDENSGRYNVTTELLRWRDNLIMAGWDKQSALPGKLRIISEAEKKITADSAILFGSADRWLSLYQSNKPVKLKRKVEVEVYCPKILIPQLIQDVIAMIVDATCYKCENINEEETLQDCRVIHFKELHEAYQWLAMQPVHDKEVVVCSDAQKLDNVLRSCDKPITAEDANVGCHHVITDVRSMLDAPESIIWIDCNGGYAFHYPYDFLSEEEAAALSVPTEQDMIAAVHCHYIHELNSVKNVTLVSSDYDAFNALTQHPMVASVLYVQKKKSEECKTGITDKPAGNELHYKAQSGYNIGKNACIGNPRMSYSALDTLIHYPFNHVVERELGLYEPFKDEDVKTVKGKVAHKVVELMFKELGCIDTSKFDEYLNKALSDDEIIDHSIGKCVLELPENRFEKEDLELSLKDSLTALNVIIQKNSLEIVGSEVAIPEDAKDKDKKSSVKMETFGDSVAFLDMVLKKKDTEDYYIFDFKYSLSSIYPDKIADNKSIQFAFYREIFSKYHDGGGKNLKCYGYYLFPKCTLYVPQNTNQGLLDKGNVQEVEVDTTKIPDTLRAMEKAYKFRMDKLHAGYIEEGEGLEIDTDYKATEGVFPLDEGDKGKKKPPYSPSHIVLKNQIR